MSKVLYALRETAANLRRNLTLTIATFVTVAVALTLSGAALLMRNGVNDITARWRGGVEFIVMMKPDATKEQIDAVTALSGSGPAFVYTVIEALAAGGTKMGLSADVALELAAQTVLGAAQLMIESKMSPEELVKMVVTPGGTTAAGLAEIEKREMAASLMAAVEAATMRGKEMAQENI